MTGSVNLTTGNLAAESKPSVTNMRQCSGPLSNEPLHQAFEIIQPETYSMISLTRSSPHCHSGMTKILALSMAQITKTTDLLEKL